MRIVWDEAKRQANLIKHGLDFDALDLDFFAYAVFRSAHSGRRQAIGWLGSRLVVSVVFRPLGAEAVSVISMRPASAGEREIHEQGI